MIRKSGWSEILSAEIEAAFGRPFCHANHDCCRFAAGVVRAITGTDLMRGFRQYRSPASASRTLRTKGRGTLLKTVIGVMARYKAQQIPPAFARRGDIVYALCAAPGGGKQPAIGICVGRQAAFASDGLAFVPMGEIKRAWAIGWRRE